MTVEHTRRQISHGIFIIESQKTTTAHTTNQHKLFKLIISTFITPIYIIAFLSKMFHSTFHGGIASIEYTFIPTSHEYGTQKCHDHSFTAIASSCRMVYPAVKTTHL